MTNTAKILNFGRGNFTGQERNVADLDDGYARLSNMLLEAYSGADLTKRQFKVLLAILRKTYGWNKPMDRITDSQLSEITKLPVKRCNEAKLELVRMNIIKQQGGMFGPNKNISEWCIPQNEGKSPKTRDKTSLKLGDCYPSKQGDTKDTITKEKRKDYSSENSGESSDQPENDLSVLLQKKKEKIIRPRILANPLTSQKTIFLWLNRMLQFRAAASGGQQKT